MSEGAGPGFAQDQRLSPFQAVAQHQRDQDVDHVGRLSVDGPRPGANSKSPPSLRAILWVQPASPDVVRQRMVNLLILSPTSWNVKVPPPLYPPPVTVTVAAYADPSWVTR